MDSIADVDIDASGKFKYILIEIKCPKTKQSKMIVRGYSHCGYHADIFDHVSPAMESKGFHCDCVGGGRIDHDPSRKLLHVYGYSQGFGRADHGKSVEILKNKYPDYKITWSNDGY